MKIVALIARLLLGLIFAFFGANGLFNFLHMPPPPLGPVGDFLKAMSETHYLFVIGFFQLVPGLLLLINRFVPLALTILAAEIVNILSFHILVQHGGLFPAPIIVALLWLLVFWRVRESFAGILAPTGAA